MDNIYYYKIHQRQLNQFCEINLAFLWQNLVCHGQRFVSSIENKGRYCFSSTMNCWCLAYFDHKKYNIFGDCPGFQPKTYATQCICPWKHEKTPSKAGYLSKIAKFSMHTARNVSICHNSLKLTYFFQCCQYLVQIFGYDDTALLFQLWPSNDKRSFQQRPKRNKSCFWTICARFT